MRMPDVAAPTARPPPAATGIERSHHPIRPYRRTITMQLMHKPEAERRRRFSPLLWMASLAGIAILALGITGTLSQFTASITNTNNQVQTAGPEAFGFSESLVVNGVPQTPACATASAGGSVNCDTINKNGAVGAPATPMAPGGVRTTTVRLANTATGAAGLSGNLTLSVQACGQTPPNGTANSANNGILAGDLCGATLITMTCAGAGQELTVGPVSLTAFATGGPYTVATAVPPDGTVDCTFTTNLPITATAVNLEGITTSQPMTWTFTQSV
jgi:hypothetical protein